MGKKFLTLAMGMGLAMLTFSSEAFDLFQQDTDFSFQQDTPKKEFQVKGDDLPKIQTDYYFRTDTDILWMDNSRLNGAWGFSYNLDLNNQTTMHPVFHILNNPYGTNTRWNLQLPGKYYEQSQDLMTIIGADLGIKYSPYVAAFDYRVVGMRVGGLKAQIGRIGSFEFDGVYTFGYLLNNQSYSDLRGDKIPWGYYMGPLLLNTLALKPKGDVALNVKGKIGRLQLEGTNLRYFTRDAQGKAVYFDNQSVAASLDVIPQRLDVSGVYARYMGLKDAQGRAKELYEVNFGWDVMPKVVRLYHVRRGSNLTLNDVFSPLARGFDNYYVVRPYRQIPMSPRGTEDLPDPLLDMAIYGQECGKSTNTGAILNFKALNASNVLTLDLASAAPPYTPYNEEFNRWLDPRRAISLETDYQNIKFKQNYFYLPAQAQAEPARQYYRLATLATPQVKLPGNLKLALRFDLERDLHYTDTFGNQVKTYAQTGLEISDIRNFWGFKNVALNSVFLWGRAGTGANWQTLPLIYNFMLRYTTPNKIAFRIQYFNSEVFQMGRDDAHGVDYYKPYRWYLNDRGISGWRLVVGMPFN